jgi:hypothetical protein
MKHAGGRPTDYKSIYNKQVQKLCLLGATDKRIANFFEISTGTLDKWKKKYPQFISSIKEGREIADAKVADSLYNRALGYSHKTSKVVIVNKEVRVVDYVERFPPDSTAAIFWLKNRDKDNWREKHEHAISGDLRIIEDEPK